MISDIKAKVDQYSPSVLDTGDLEYVRQSVIGELFTADWKQRLLRAGKLWSVTVGSVAADTGIAGITGGGSGTCIDLDQPEIAIGVDAGYFLIPVEVRVGLILDCDADDEYGHIVAFGDRTAGVPTSVTGTIETPVNLLDGGAAFPGRAFSAITADITDPTVDELLDFEHVAYALTTSGVYQRYLKMDYKPEAPSALAGPCGLYVSWGGTAAATAMALVVVAAVPSTWLPTS